MGLARALLLLALLALLQTGTRATGGHDDEDRELLQDADAALNTDRPVSYKVCVVENISEVYY
jgi:hypothetical protein